MKRIEPTDLSNETYEWITSTLKKKLNLFDYVTEDAFVKSLLSGNYLVFLTDHVLVFCEIVTYETRLKVMSINVIKHSKDDDVLEHQRDTLLELEGIAKIMEVDRVILEGRIGWSRVFKDYNVEKVTLYKEL